jgi:hypothetical protein
MANLNDARAKVTHITLSDGVKRELKYTLNALAEMEDRYGSIDVAFQTLEAGSIKAVRFFLWAGLLHTEENLTEMQIGSMIDVQALEEIMATVGDAFANDMPTKGEQLPNA